MEHGSRTARSARRTRWVEDWWSDTRYAVRAMARSPAFTAAAVLTLAVGIGANTAVWSVVDALMLRSLPVQRPDELHAIRKAGIDAQSYLVSYAAMERMRGAVPDSIPIAGMSSTTRLYAAIGDTPEAVQSQLVSGNWFSTLGVGATLGRVFSAAEDATLGGHPVAVLSQSFWRQRFGADRSVLGRTIRVNGTPLTVIGVAEPGFAGLTVGQAVELWIPITMQHEVRYIANNATSGDADTEKPWLPQPGVSWLTLVARVPAGGVASATLRLDHAFRAVLEEQLAPRDSASRAYGMREHAVLEPIRRGLSPLRLQFEEPLRALMASVALILLISCGNLAGLLLARGAARGHEISVRISLGAQPGRLVRQVLTESVTLAAVGGVASLVVAHWGGVALLRLASSGTRAIPLAVSLNGRVLGFAFGVSIVTGLLFGLAPALRVARTSLHDAFKVGGRVVSGGSHRLPLGRALVMSQIALSLVLVTSAALFVRTFQNLLSIDPGYDRERVVEARLDVRAAGYAQEQLPPLYQRLLDAARGVPGVRSASLSLFGLAGGARRVSGFVVPGRALPPGENSAQEIFVTTDYLSTVGIPLLRGRAFAYADREDAPRVAIVSQAAAKHFFGTEDVIGARFGHASPSEFEIVGVVRDARVNALRDAPARLVFYPLAQGPREFVSSLEVRSVGAAESIVADLRSAITRVDRALPVRDVVTLSDLLERGLTIERLVARIAGSFGLLALLLAGIGLYGVISYSVSRRTNEIGVRLALGASPADVSWVVLRDSFLTIAAGLVLGVLLWFPLLGLAERLVYGLSPRDPGALAVASALLVAVGVVASVVPAIRAARTDPMVAIRAD